MSDEQPAKRRGRPPKDPADRKDGNLTFRTRGDMRRQLSEAAEKNGRSISEEVEKRLEDSFTKETVAKVIEDAQDAYAVQAIHSTLEELQEDLGHPWSLAVAFHMGQSFTEFHRMMKLKTPDEVWFDNPKHLQDAAAYMHKCLDNLFANWNLITYRVSLWGLFQKYTANIFRKKADGTYIRRKAEDRARREAEEQTSAES